MTTRMKAIQQHFPHVLLIMLYKVVMTLDSLHETVSFKLEFLFTL